MDISKYCSNGILKVNEKIFRHLNGRFVREKEKNLIANLNGIDLTNLSIIDSKEINKIVELNPNFKYIYFPNTIKTISTKLNAEYINSEELDNLEMIEDGSLNKLKEFHLPKNLIKLEPKLTSGINQDVNFIIDNDIALKEVDFSALIRFKQSDFAFNEGLEKFKFTSLDFLNDNLDFSKCKDVKFTGEMYYPEASNPTLILPEKFDISSLGEEEKKLFDRGVYRIDLSEDKEENLNIMAKYAKENKKVLLCNVDYTNVDNIIEFIHAYKDNNKNESSHIYLDLNAKVSDNQVLNYKYALSGNENDYEQAFNSLYIRNNTQLHLPDGKTMSIFTYKSFSFNGKIIDFDNKEKNLEIMIDDALKKGQILVLRNLDFHDFEKCKEAFDMIKKRSKNKDIKLILQKYTDPQYNKGLEGKSQFYYDNQELKNLNKLNEYSNELFNNNLYYTETDNPFLIEEENYWDHERLLETNAIIDELVDKIKSKDLTPLETVLFLHNYITDYEAKKEELEQGKDMSRCLLGFLGKPNAAIVCAGYASFMKTMIDRLDRDDLKCYFDICDVSETDDLYKREGHLKNFIVMEENGKKRAFNLDATWDASTNVIKPLTHMLYPMSDRKEFSGKYITDNNPNQTLMEKYNISSDVLQIQYVNKLSKEFYHNVYSYSENLRDRLKNIPKEERNKFLNDEHDNLKKIILTYRNKHKIALDKLNEWEKNNPDKLKDKYSSNEYIELKKAELDSLLELNVAKLKGKSCDINVTSYFNQADDEDYCDNQIRYYFSSLYSKAREVLKLNTPKELQDRIDSQYLEIEKAFPSCDFDSPITIDELKKAMMSIVDKFQDRLNTNDKVVIEKFIDLTLLDSFIEGKSTFTSKAKTSFANDEEFERINEDYHRLVKQNNLNKENRNNKGR